MAAEIVEALPGMAIGKGFDAMSCDLKVSESVIGEKKKPPAGASQMGGFSFPIVKGSAEFRESLEEGVSVGAGLGAFSASAKTNFAESCKVSTHSTVCIPSFHATNPFETFDDTPRLTPNAAKLLTLGKNKRFRELFGNRFMSGRFEGGGFYGIVRIETETQGRDTEIALAIDASYDPFKASGKVDNELSESPSKVGIEILTFQSGGKAVLRCTPIDTVHRKFPDKETPNRCSVPSAPL